MESEQKLKPSDGASYGEFGFSVGVSDSHIVVGSRYENVLGNDYGRTYVYKLGNSEIEMMGSEQILPAGSSEHSWTVAISGSRFIVGNSLGDGKVRSSGSVTVYEIGNTRTDTLSTAQNIFASDGERIDNFGTSVDISGNHVIVGAIYDDESAGAAYIYEIGANQDYSMSSEQKIIASNGSRYSRYGSSVAVSGDCVVIGDQKTTNTYIYNTGFTSEGTMSSEQTVKTNIDTGKAIDISEDFLIIGSPQDENSNGVNVGSICFYNLESLD
jgi:hypothetical protein